jgi:hypothetical protein
MVEIEDVYSEISEQENMEQKTRWISYQNAYVRDGRWICYPGIQEDVRCNRGEPEIIAGARSLNEQDLHETLTYFKVPQAGIESIRSKLVFKIFDEYANILKSMYSTRFNGRPRDNDNHDQTDSTPGGPIPPLITSHLAAIKNIRRPKKKDKRGVG